MYGLERVELRSTDLFRQCPYTPRLARQRQQEQQRQRQRPSDNDINDGSCPADVGREPYRRPDGSCNNPARPEWGSSFSPFLRFLPPVYGDDIGNAFRLPRRSRRQSELPSARRISTAVHKDSTAETQQFSMMVRTCARCSAAAFRSLTQTF